MIRKDYFGESKNIEFKRELPATHGKFIKDVIAFSNCTGGKIICQASRKKRPHIYGSMARAGRQIREN